MIQYERPCAPTGFAARVKGAEVRVSQHFAGPGTERRCEFPPLWGEYREHFARAQHHKCGFCEKLVESFGEPVEHFFPKGEVHELAHPGTCNARGKATGRRRGCVVVPGYHWKAYDWKNWLYACAVCNTVYKRNYFPLDCASWSPPPDLRTTVPLLLNPYDDDPVRFLMFDTLGAVQPRQDLAPGDARRAQATIDTCGLFRDWLVNQRLRVAQDAWSQIDLATQAWRVRSRSLLEHAVEALQRAGADQAPHAGVVRSLVEAHLVPWKNLPQLPVCLRWSLEAGAQ